MERISFDTTFLIDLQREKKKAPGPAHAFLRAYPDATPCLSLIALAEFAEGFLSPRDPACLLMVDSFDLLPFDRTVAECYSSLSRDLRIKGTRIGSNDLWIAATALVAGLPLVTRNLRELQRVPNLIVLGY
jgi:predicted nucleic acid-binding protein